jgi:hypothetical protein
MKNKYIVVCGIIVEADNDDIAKEIVYDACKISELKVHIEYVHLEEGKEKGEETND